MKQNIHKTDEQLWADIEAVFAANRPTLDEAEWIARTREVSDAEFLDCQTLALQDAERETTAGRHPARRIALWSAIAAVAAIVIVAGFGVVLHQVQAPSRLTAQVSPTNGTHKSHQWDTPVPPVGHADTTSRIIAHVQSHKPTRSVVTHKRSSIPKEPLQSEISEQEELEQITESEYEQTTRIVYINSDQMIDEIIVIGQQTPIERPSVSELRARGERLTTSVMQQLQTNIQY